jgi:signal transduction histidine kinase
MARNRPRPTVRTRLTAAATGLMLLMLVVASIVIVTIQRTTMISAVDESLRQRVDNLQPVDPEATVLPTEGDAEDTFAQLLDRRGSVVGSSSNVVGAPAATTRRPPPPAGSLLTTEHLDRPDGHFRVYVRVLRRGGNGRYLVVGKNLDDVRENVRVLTVSLAVATPIIGLLLAALAWWVVGRTLRPVQAIRTEVEDIQGDQLHRRVPVPDTDDEIAELARTMNDMLGRLESATSRQQQLVDDASHELRTPLTRMITDVQVSLAHPDQEPSAETMQRLLVEATELQQLLHDLLYLARSPHTRTARDEVDLDDVAVSAAREVRARSAVDVDTTGVRAARVSGDGRAIARAVANLLDNAVRHAESRVAISTDALDGVCRVLVDDDGTGIAEADRQRVFERFTRLDEARDRTAGGAGLGLAIVSDIAARHNGSVEVTDAELGGARVILAFPADEDPPPTA